MRSKNVKNLKITIITVCYNSEKYIKNTLDSVACQKFKNIEHLIIDGNSTDETVKLVQNYPHIKKIISESDKGIYHAMNKGLRIATGDIIGFLNSDDFYENNEVLLRVANIFKNNLLLDACYADLIYVDSFDISKNIRYWRSNKFVKGLFAKGWCPPHPTFFVRRSLYRRFGNFDLNYRIASDVELMMRLLEVKKINAQYIPELWIKMRLGGTTNKNFKNILIQNKEVLCALNSHNLSVNLIIFFFHKMINRSLQFFKKNNI
jgi:glycosyltransferase involved in cell wall biosynthesis